MARKLFDTKKESLKRELERKIEERILAQTGLSAEVEIAVGGERRNLNGIGVRRVGNSGADGANVGRNFFFSFLLDLEAVGWGRFWLMADGCCELGF